MESSSNAEGCMGQCTGFMRTHKGMILLAEIIACILILICYGASVTPGYSGLACFMLIYGIVIFIFFMCNLHHQITFIHWGWTDFIRALIGAVAFLITSLIVLIGHRDGAGIAAAVIGMLTGILFGYDAYTILPTLRKSHAAAPTGPSDGM
ncbi:proteolipid protein 2 isoform X2 [Podarcis muralis]|uniref:proteolipid protein 2 n=1 Tax=Podarcis raffonei TaxID=65483 RepID=UPI00232925D9|nr:proteolipid protein 2 [Podarcis raffonei]